MHRDRRGRYASGVDYGAEEASSTELLPIHVRETTGGFDERLPSYSKSCLAPVARVMPDRVVLALLAGSLAWCWVSSWLLMSTGSNKLTWNVTLYQLMPLTMVSLLAGIKIYLLKPLEDELSRFRAENDRFKDSLAQLQSVAGSLKAKNNELNMAKEELQLTISDLENVRGVIEMYAAKTHGDVGQILEEVKTSVRDQLNIQKRTTLIQKKVRGLIDIQLTTALACGASQATTGPGGLRPEDVQDIALMLAASDSSNGKELASVLGSARGSDDGNGSPAEKSVGDMMRDAVAKLVQLDKDEDADPEMQSSYRRPDLSATQRPPVRSTASCSPASESSTTAASTPTPPWSVRSGSSKDSSAFAAWPAPRAPSSGRSQPSSGRSHASTPLPPRTGSRVGPSMAGGAAESPTFKAAPQRGGSEAPSREVSLDQCSERSARSGRTPRISFSKDAVNTYFGEAGPPSKLDRLPEDAEPDSAGLLRSRSGGLGFVEDTGAPFRRSSTGGLGRVEGPDAPPAFQVQARIRSQETRRPAFGKQNDELKASIRTALQGGGAEGLAEPAGGASLRSPAAAASPLGASTNRSPLLNRQISRPDCLRSGVSFASVSESSVATDYSPDRRANAGGRTYASSDGSGDQARTRSPSLD